MGGGRTISTTAPESYTEKMRRERADRVRAIETARMPPRPPEEVELYEPNLPDALTVMQAQSQLANNEITVPEPTNKQRFAGLFPGAQASVDQYAADKAEGGLGYLKRIGRKQEARREDFGKAFPGAQASIDQYAEDKEQGGIGYLRRLGRLQEGAAQRQAEESDRAAKFMAMLQQNQDIIASMDPAENMPIQEFQNGGGVSSNVGRAYLDPETGEPLGLGARISRLFSGVTGGLGEGELYQDPDAMSPQELLNFPSEKEIRQASYNVPEEERLTPQQLDAMSRAEKRQRLIDRALERRGTELTDPFDVQGMVDRLVAPPFRTQGILRDAEPTDRQRFAKALGLPLKDFDFEQKAPPPKKKRMFDNVDIGRLQAFLAGGGGQTSTAGALGGGLRGLMGEDQRREALASKEAIEAAKIASQRYGIEQDYNAALAKLGFDKQKMVFDAQSDMLKERFKADSNAAAEAMDRIENNSEYQREFMRLSAEYGDNPAALGAELAAVAARIARDDVDIQRLLRDGEGAGAFEVELPSGD